MALIQGMENANKTGSDLPKVANGGLMEGLSAPDRLTALAG
jgi:hypothetical protein